MKWETRVARAENSEWCPDAERGESKELAVR